MAGRKRWGLGDEVRYFTTRGPGSEGSRTAKFPSEALDFSLTFN